MDKLAKIIASLIALAVALIPFWIWLICRALLAPQGFWQNLVVFGLGAWLLGGLQIFLLIVFLWFLFTVIWD